MSQTNFERLGEVWSDIEARFLASEPMRRVAEGRIEAEHYAAYLRETYFYTREDPQIQAACTAYFRGADRELVKHFLQHAASEVGHDQMALDDMAALGFESSGVPDEAPLSATTALIAYPFYTTQYRRPVSYLGYLYFLEFLPTSKGASISEALGRAGVPADALTFLQEHTVADVGHNRLMKVYAERLIHDTADFDAVVEAMNVTADLYEAMISAAFRSVDESTSRLVRRERVAA